VVVQIDVGSAMEYLHALSPAIIHRDLKSHNILRSQNGVYKVCDFGLVKVRHTTAGTPAYMAPGMARFLCTHTINSFCSALTLFFTHY
jgi:serine/threonine protein kinase